MNRRYMGSVSDTFQDEKMSGLTQSTPQRHTTHSFRHGWSHPVHTSSRGGAARCEWCWT